MRKDKNELELKEGREKYKIYHLKISGGKLYWLHIEIPANTTFIDLDEFLRGIWLECCGHLSSFTIHGEKYDDQRMMEETSNWLEYFGNIDQDSQIDKVRECIELSLAA